MDFGIVFICLCGGGLIFFALLFNGIYIRNIFRGRKAHIRLAEAGGYSLLHDSPKDVLKVFGGEINGHPFAFRPAADTYRTTDGDGTSSTRVTMLMQFVFPLANHSLADISAVRKAKLRGIPDSFDQIWTVTPSAERLSPPMQTQMFEFAATHAHPAGFHWPTYRSKPIVRKLTLLERSKWENSFPADLFADAVSVLIYDHPTANIDLNEMHKILSDMASLATTLES